MKFLFLLVFLYSAATSMALGNGLSISDKGTGPGSEKTPFDIAHIRQLFPEYEVEAGTQYTEVEMYPVIDVNKTGTTLLRINPDASRQSIFSVQVLGKEPDSRFPWHLGEIYSVVYESGPDDKCVPMGEEMSGKVSCPAPGHTNIHLVFSGQWDGPDGQIPPEEILCMYFLEQIVWIPAVRQYQ